MAGFEQKGLGRILRVLSVFVRRKKLIPALEFLVLAWFVITLVASYLLASGGRPGEELLAPPAAGLLVVANLIPAIALLVLIGRRIAYARAGANPLRGTGRLHSRLVGIFSTIAAIPVLLLVIFASLLFQYGFDFWYSQKAKGIFENANELAQTYYHEKQQTLIANAELMASDLNYNLDLAPLGSDQFISSLGYQLYQRSLSEGAVLRISKDNGVQSLALVNPYRRATDNWVPPEIAKQLLAKGSTVFRDSGSRLEAVTPIPNRPGLFLYASRVDDNQTGTLAQTRRFSSILNDYNSLVDRSRSLQLQFNVALFLIALLVVGAAVAIALSVADRLVRPVGELVEAAEKISAGNLASRVRPPGTRDEIATLANAFNLMTGRLEEQRAELVDANALLERRRAFIETVLGSVTAGVIAVNSDDEIRIINNRALEILGLNAADLQGEKLERHAPQVAAFLHEGKATAIIELETGQDRLTLAVNLVEDEHGHVITFDDITAQLADQRRAAWSDVARRVAHEIKNPLTPIQLAAERLKRRFAKAELGDPATAERLTDTIIRQVSDLRRMVDEFSSFARMPKPVFQEESLTEICRQALFLQEVANSSIRFQLHGPSQPPMLVCDRRQLGQAFTNVIKNAVEAIEQAVDQNGPAEHQIDVEITDTDDEVSVSVSDTGIGLPAERERIVEPYMTTRKAGTGLGLAIVKKIAEEHGGTINFLDRKGGGTVVRLQFHRKAIHSLMEQHQANNQEQRDDAAPANLTRKETV